MFHFNIFFQAIVVIRYIFDAIKSYSLYSSTHSHTKTQDPEKVMKNKEHWNQRVSKYIKKYLKFHEYWLKKDDTRILIVLYEELKSDLGNQLRKMAKFLNIEVTDEIIKCVQQNSEGKYHRKNTKNKSDPFYEALNNDTRKDLRVVYDSVMKLVKNRNSTDTGTFYF